MWKKKKPFPLLLSALQSGWQISVLQARWQVSVLLAGWQVRAVALVCRLLAVATSPGLSPARMDTYLVLSHWGLLKAYRDFGR